MDPAALTAKLDVASLTNKIIQEIVFYTTAISVSVLLSELPGLNFIVGVIAGFIAKACVSDEDKNKLRDQKSRQKIADQMPKILKDAKIVTDFKSSIAKAMASVKNQYESIVNDTVNIVVDMVMFRRFSEKE